MQLWCSQIIKYKLIFAVAKVGKAHKQFWDFLVSIKNAQCPVFAWLLTWFRSGLLSSFQHTVGLIVQFSQRGTPAFPFSVTETLPLWTCSRALLPSGARGGTSSPISSTRRGAGVPRASPALLGALPLWQLPACSHTCSGPLNCFMRKAA